MRPMCWPAFRSNTNRRTKTMPEHTRQTRDGEFTDVRGFPTDAYPTEVGTQKNPLIGIDEWGGWYYDDTRGYLEQYIREEATDEVEERRTPMEFIDEATLGITEIDIVEFLEGLDVLTDEGEKLLAEYED